MVGVRMMPTQITQPSSSTITDCFPVRFTYALITDRPVRVPMTMKIERNPANCQFRVPMIINCTLDTKVLNMTKYSAVADDTVGEIPRLSKSGLNIILPPTPTAIAIVLPISEKPASFSTFFAFSFKSV